MVNPARRSRPALLAALLVAMAVSGCARREPALYRWDSFPDLEYRHLIGEGTDDEQIAELEAISDRARAESAELPPGLRAHLGLLQLRAGHPDRARLLWQAEIAAFPEAAPFIERHLLAKLADRPVQVAP